MVFMTVVIDALENCEIAIVNMPGAFMHVAMDELVHMQVTGAMVKLLIQIEKKLYEDCVVYENARWCCMSSCYDRFPSTTPCAEPPRDAKDSGSARSHSTHLETSSSNRP